MFLHSYCKLCIWFKGHWKQRDGQSRSGSLLMLSLFDKKRCPTLQATSFCLVSGFLQPRVSCGQPSAFLHNSRVLFSGHEVSVIPLELKATLGTDTGMSNMLIPQSVKGLRNTKLLLC